MVTLGKCLSLQRSKKIRITTCFQLLHFLFHQQIIVLRYQHLKHGLKKWKNNQIKVLPDGELWYIHKSQHQQFHLRKEKCLPDQKNARGNCSLHVITSKIKTCQMQFFYLEPDNRASKHNYCSLSCKRISEIPPGINLLRSWLHGNVEIRSHKISF